MITIKAQHRLPLMIGIEGENKVRQVEFDISDFVASCGDGVAQLIFKRQRDSVPYPCVITRDGNTVLWVITNVETAQVGDFGACELLYYVDDALAKSETWQVVVKDSLGTPREDVPDPYRVWSDQVLETGLHVEAERTKAETAALASELSAQNSAEHRDAALISADRAKSLADQVGVNSGLQADLNQNDPTKAGYVQNRTHYEELICEEVIPELTGPWNFIGHYFPSDFKLIYGDEYIVRFNGVTYRCVCNYAWFTGNKKVPTIGDNTFPFQIRELHEDELEKYPGYYGTVHVWDEERDGYIITISVDHLLEDVIHPIDPKFMRLTSPNGHVFELAVNDDGTLGTVPVT